MILCLVWGLKLLLVDLGINKKYEKIITVALAVVFVICVFFFAMHLTAFYPVYKGA
jgi:hypothetical protein